MPISVNHSFFTHTILVASAAIILSLQILSFPVSARTQHAPHLHSPLESKLKKKVEQAGFKVSGHEQGGGPMMLADNSEHSQVIHKTQACPTSASVKTYDVAAIQVTMVLNRWGDRDPDGYMYVIRDNIPAVRQQELAAKNTDTNFAKGFGLTPGLSSDPIQPLVLRANIGDCVRIAFTNLTHEGVDEDVDRKKKRPASLHVHGADFILKDSGKPALSTNPNSIALPGDTIHLEWYVDPGFYQENTHYLHSHGPNMRWLISHGLMGAMIVEPVGSEYFNPRDGSSLCTAQSAGVSVCKSSWDAMISPGDNSSDFREFTMVYHEIGNEQYLPVSKDEKQNLFIDPLTGSYKPNGRAINYRSESFWRRLGEAEVMAKVLDLKPDSSADHSPDAPAYIHKSKEAQKVWKKINAGLIGDLNNFADESQAYGTYAFGDPATPIPRSYLGDPTKFRIVHGGSETFHVPHLHGGGIQWQRQPKVGKNGPNPNYTPIDAGLKKHFTSRMPSSGNDAQTIGPSETYDLEVGCGSGGCQQVTGDFLFHCHVASHYISGMWHFWRVYNTLQNDSSADKQDYGINKTDELGRLAELPDRKNRKSPAVTSTELIDKTVAFSGQSIKITNSNLNNIIEIQLPPQGRSKTMQDATVFDWKRQGLMYLNEPDSKHVWPNFASLNPGKRVPLKFDPQTGKLAFPTLRPHLGKRPPFAPNHGPAPYLEPTGHVRAEPALPGANGPDSLCPSGAPRRHYKIHAIQTPIQVTDDITDSQGMLFVVKNNEDRARSDPEFKVPLAIRANQGDCVDLILVNELEETGELAELSKTNIHQHFFSFDVQASDGVISGASFEQSPRPIYDKGMSFPIMRDVAQGATRVRINDTSSFHPGTVVAIGIDQNTDIFETAVIDTIDSNSNILNLREPLKHAHNKNERVSVEFVRYRWFAERQTGASYFHDHVDALKRWGHGLFGAIIAEPRGSTYHDPHSGEETLSGPIMDIHVAVNQTVLPGLKGSFREFVAFFTDRSATTGIPTQEKGREQKNSGSINLRAEPLRAGTSRGDGPDHLALSSITHGDPATPLYQAYTGDPIIFRLLTTATEEIHPFHITGHHFRWERFQENSPPLTVYGVGISERFNAYIEAAGGAARKPGDYLYYNGTQRHFLDGVWGILRVFDSLQSELKPLPGREPHTAEGTFPGLIGAVDVPPSAQNPGNPCSADATTKHFDVSAIDKALLLNNPATTSSAIDQQGRMYVLDADVEAVLKGDKQANPLVIRANSGDCITVKLTNLMKKWHASFHLDSPSFDPQGSLGITLGLNPEQTVPPHKDANLPPASRTYRYFADEELGAILIRDFGNPLKNGAKGLYGALIVEPQGSTYVDPYTGAPLTSGVEAVIQNPEMADFREFVLVYHDADPDIGTFVMPYDEEIDQMTLVNYRAEPIKKRLSQFELIMDKDRYVKDSDMEQARSVYNSNSKQFKDPQTNVFSAFSGDPIRFRIISGYSEQTQMFSLEAHEWELTPEIPGSDRVSSRYLPSTGVLNVRILSAGGPNKHTGDYMWSNHRQTHQKIGQWGLMRVLATGGYPDLKPLSD